jgi:cobalt-precorrin-5B (C1)-methyltransferase
MAFQNLVWGCFFGKLVKLAQGHAYTHAGDAALDMRALADLARREHAACADDVGHCVTAAHALELLLADPAGPRVLERTTRTAAHVAQGFARRPVRIHLFHTDGRELLAL